MEIMFKALLGTVGLFPETGHTDVSGILTLQPNRRRLQDYRTRRFIMKRFGLVLGMLLISVSLFALTDSVTHDITLNVDEVAMIGLADASAITLAITAPATAGLPPVGQTDSTKYLHYTSLIDMTKTRAITVEWDLANAPPGTQLLCSVTNDLGTGLGTKTSAVVVSNVAQNIITAIKSGNTGTAGTDGANLLYEFEVTDPTLLDTESDTPTTITFTLTEAS